MDQKHRNLYSAGSIVLLAFLFITLVILSDILLQGQRLDLTRNKQYTLSQGTLNILSRLQEPVNLYLFFSGESSRNLPQIRRYARWVGEMLDEMADHSKGDLTILKKTVHDQIAIAEFGLSHEQLQICLD